jgi:glycerophosphoryl diester phosphodiesterase
MLEGYRATFELGGDGNEIDIRSTKNGVLVCFHDDMLDHLLQGQGDVSELTWEELRRLSFGEPGSFGEHCRIPTLVEVLELHREHGGLLHLDIKRPGIDQAIADLLDRILLQLGKRRSPPVGSTPAITPLQRPRPVRRPQ